MSFFKKNKSKSKKARVAPKPSAAEIEQDIARMDQERNLDRQLEELNAKLNIKPEDEAAKDALDAMVNDISDTEDISETPTDRIVTIGKTGFLKDSLDDFIPPAFSAKLSKSAENIDVTPTANSEVEKLVEEARRAAQAEAEANAKLDALKKEQAATEKAVTEAAKALEEKNAAEKRALEKTAKDQEAEAEAEAAAEDELPSFNPDPALAAPGRLDMGEMRVNVAQISADIQSGEELYRRALERVEGLMGYVEKAEVDFSVLNRVEPENRRLKARLRTLQGELEHKTGKLGLVKADLEDHQQRLAEKTAQFEDARGKLVAATTSLKSYERALTQSKTETERLAMAIERHKTALGVEGRENKVLREKVSELSAALETRQNEYLSASKKVESLRVDCDDFREQAEQRRSEINDLRSALNLAKRQNNAMKGEMVSLHQDIKTFKTQYEYNLIDHEERGADLESKVANLTKDLRTKEDIARTAAREVATLRKARTEQDIERSRLEKQIEAATAEIDDNLRLSEAKITEKTKALKTQLSELQSEMIRRDEMAQMTVLENEELRRKLSEADIDKARLRSELDTQTRQLEAAIINNPTQELEAQIANISEQVRVKDAIVQSAAQDMTDMRKAREAQMNENQRLEDLVHDQKFQLEAAQKALRVSQQNETDLDQKYKDIAAALSLNQARRRSENPVAPPMPQPDISDEFNALSGEDVEDRIMDYKFGLRKDIV